jgi:malonyl-CoA/methylmalonyl-CoA synthetase
MTHDTLSTLISDALVRHRADVFLTTPDGRGMTYGEADGRSAQVAGALRRTGARPGDRVAVQVEKSPLSILLYLACVRAGFVFVPVNPGYTEPEVDYLFGDVEPSVVVRDPGRLTTTPPYAHLSADENGLGTLADLADAEPTELAAVRAGPDDTAAILYTSGTTGRPKGAVLSQRNLVSNAQALSATWAFDPRDVLLHALPLFHTHGLFVAVNCVLDSGSSMILLPRFDVDQVVQHLPHSTVFMGVPTYYTRLLADERLTPSLCAGMRLFTAGSAPLPAAAHVEFSARTGHAIVERYGMTETSIITSNRIGDETPGSVGPPLDDVKVRVVAAGTSGGPGSVEVRGPNVFSGYWRRPESVDEFTPDGYFRTGDLGELDPSGRLIIVGRTKDLIISGGNNVYPKEVEDALGLLDVVDECAVVGQPDDDLGERVVAFVVGKPGVPVDPDRVRLEVRRFLAGYKAPKEVHVIDALPRNAMGKVEKAKLRAALDSA